jgi:alpha-galactosidase
MSDLSANEDPPEATRAEIELAARWLDEHLQPGSSRPPFSFVYGGEPYGGDSREIPAAAGPFTDWESNVADEELDRGRTRRTLTWRHPTTGLELRCVAVTYADFPVVEWTVYFGNAGPAPTPILADIQALDLRLERAGQGEFVLHHNRGDYNSPDSYQPFAQTLWHNSSLRFAPLGGRPTNSAFPYYNLQSPGGGLILAIGWPGQWAAAFSRDTGRGLAIRAGQELTHLSLRPGEEIRTPLIELLFWQGDDPGRAQNMWRRWMVAHNLPRQEDRSPAPMFTFCSGGFFPNLKCDEAGEKLFIDALHHEGVKLDYWWMDAGWYPCANWPEVGTWEPDPVRFPNGLRAISDYVHAQGSQLIVWFEPERVAAGTWLYEQHPEWLLSRPNGAEVAEWARRWRLLDLGNPVARAWLTDHVDRLISQQGIDLYRQDFNIDPLDFWRGADAPDRQGMTENLYVQGYLAYWDELRRRHPGLLIDSCASGGRRNDLETLRRSVPLLRSDYQSFAGDPAYAPGNQGHTYGLAAWIPYFGQGVYYSSDQYVYAVRSHLCPAVGFAVDVRRPDIDWDAYRRMAAQWREVAPCFAGDYYPLTPYSLDDEAWLAWQFHVPAQSQDSRLTDRPPDPPCGQSPADAGFIQAFRHPQAPEASRLFRLHGLNPSAQYVVTDLDERTSRVFSGRQLAEKGLPVAIPGQPGAALVTYHREAHRVSPVV